MEAWAFPSGPLENTHMTPGCGSPMRFVTVEANRIIVEATFERCGVRL